MMKGKPSQTQRRGGMESGRRPYIYVVLFVCFLEVFIFRLGLVLCATNTHKVVPMRKGRIGMKVDRVEWEWKGNQTKTQGRGGMEWEGDPTSMLYVCFIFKKKRSVYCFFFPS